MVHHSCIRTSFSGSYAPGDVDFLLKQVQIEATDVTSKEAAIQSGKKHYSEMISEEARPDERYLKIFQDAWTSGRDRIAAEALAIAKEVRNRIASGALPEQISLCSLVRAGAPLGVLLQRALRDLGVDSAHFGISIIRDRGIDMNAMNHVISSRGPDGILFVDGWTGKGAITRELRRSWQENTGRHPTLIVLADPCGMADIAGSNEDWLIPSGILGANISGLISRSILNAEVIGEGDFHGYVPVSHLSDIDFSAAFADDIHGLMKKFQPEAIGAAVVQDQTAGADTPLQEASAKTVSTLMARFETSNSNRIKPGIAEATRAVLRRKPHHVLVSSDVDPDLTALIHLCAEGGVPYSVSPECTGPYRAITIIAKVH